MRFNPKVRLDTSRMRNAGRGGGGGMVSGPGRVSIPIGRTGGGLGGILVVILFLVLSQCLGDGGAGGGTGGTGGTGGMVGGSGGGVDASRMQDAGRYAGCRSGADANGSADCARVAVENSLADYWSATLSEQAGAEFRPERSLVTFTGAVDTGCGQATSDVGPFYCPLDESIYLDTSFFAAVLQRQLDGPAGSFVEPYVLAHEYGHHIQNLLGTMSRVRTQRGPLSDAVRLELQADCYAGMWAGEATSTPDSSGQVLLQELTDRDIEQAIAAAAAVGDDRIQRRTRGQVTEETWTHGSAESRVRWFRTGLREGTLRACDTFSASTL